MMMKVMAMMMLLMMVAMMVTYWAGLLTRALG